jgi:acyl-CoA thioesterase FadM
MTVAAVGHASFTLHYEVLRVKDGTVVAIGKSVQVIFDYEAGKSAQIPDSLREKLEVLITG